MHQLANPPENARTFRPIPLLIGVALSLIAGLSALGKPNPLQQLQFPFWIIGVLLITLALWLPSRPRARRYIPLLEYLTLGALIIAALAIRIVQLETMPFVLSGDEGSAGLVGWQFAEGSRVDVLGTGWFSFPAFYFWLVSLGQLIFGRTVFAIRLISALAGTMTIAATYLAGKQLFSRRVGFAAAAWLAAFHYHVFFSRVAYNNIFDGLFLVAAIAFLHRGWQTGHRNDFLGFGVAVGLAQYFYTTSHAIPIICGLWMVWLHYNLAPIRSRLRPLLAAALVAAVIVLPLLMNYIESPGSLTFTVGRVSLLDPELIGPAAAALGTSPLGLILEQTLVTALGLTVSELQGIYSGTGQPMLFGISAIIFYLGISIAIARWRQPRYGILLVSIGLSLVIGGLSIQAPSSQRLILLPPILALIIASGLETVATWLDRRIRRARHLVTIAMSILLGWMIYQNAAFIYLDYFPRETYGSLNGEVTQEMVEFLADEPASTALYFIAGERMQFDSIPSMAYLAPQLSAVSLDPTDLLLPNADGPGRMLFIVLPDEQEAIARIAAAYPDSLTIARYNRHGRLLLYVHVVDPTP